MATRRPSVAVLFRTHFWDDFARRAARRMQRQSDGADFFVLANETGQAPFDVRPFDKIGFTEHDLAGLGLPCVAGEPDKDVLWWNCDYPLYYAQRAHPGYDYYFVMDFDAAANTPLVPIAQAMADSGAECVASFAPNALLPTWPHAESCRDLPYDAPAWVALINLFVSARAARLLLAERQRLARSFLDGRTTRWPICEAFVASALASGGIACVPLRRFADVTNFGTELVLLESDPRAQAPGSFAHSVLDPDRFWRKFQARTFNVLLSEGRYDRLREAREALLRIERASHAGWRIASGVGNLALDKPATQSSVSGASRKPFRDTQDARAVDARGGNCGVLNGQHGFHTEIEANPWWQVDLLSGQPVQEVRLFNRAVSPERARHLSVHVSLDGQFWNRVYRKADDRVFAGIDDPLVCRLAHPVPARHVRVALDRTDWFHLDEIEVYGPISGA